MLMLLVRPGIMPSMSKLFGTQDAVLAILHMLYLPCVRSLIRSAWI
jgi:hypothetical protein